MYTLGTLLEQTGRRRFRALRRLDVAKFSQSPRNRRTRDTGGGRHKTWNTRQYEKYDQIL